MRRLFTGLAVATAMVLAARAWADPPEIKGITPYGAQRGVATDVAISGGNLAGHPRILAPFGVDVDAAAVENKDAANWKLKLTVQPDVPVGIYAVRVKTEEGLSNPFLFAVGQLPQVAEKEENSTFETAQAIPSLCVVEGQAAGNDVDFFKFSGKKGQRIVVDAQCARIGSGIDPTIRLTTASRSYVASADDSPGLLTDARLCAVLPEDTDYVIELSDSSYQGGARPIYRLVVGPVPVAEEIYPIGGRQGETVGFELRGGTLPGLRVAAATLVPIPGREFARVRITNQTLGVAAPSDPVLDLESSGPVLIDTQTEVREPSDPTQPPVRVSAPVVLNGRIDPAGDEDRFVISAAPGQRLRLRVLAADLHSALDGQLQVLGAKNAVLATADDTNMPPIIASKKANRKTAPSISPDPSLDFTVPPGQNELTVVVRDLEGRGGIGYPYRLVVEPVKPSFDVRPDDAQVSIRKGGTVAVDVGITRRGYNGPITLKVTNPPAGLTVREGTVPEGQAAGVLTLSAAADANFDVVDLNVVGEGQGPDGPIVEPVRKPLVFAQQGDLPTNYLYQTGVPAAPAEPGPVALETSETPIEVVHGFDAPIPVKVKRTEKADGAIDLAAALGLPGGLTFAAGKIAEKATEGTATIKAAPEAPVGKVTIALTGKGKFANKDQTFDTPAVTIQVVRPAQLELAAPSAEIKAGTTAEIKGKLVRKGPFKEPVTIKVSGLPAGLKAEPVTVAPDASEFLLKVVAEPKAAAATATAQLAMAFQLNKKDYSTPPTPLAVKVLPAK